MAGKAILGEMVLKRVSTEAARRRLKCWWPIIPEWSFASPTLFFATIMTRKMRRRNAFYGYGNTGGPLA